MLYMKGLKVLKASLSSVPDFNKMTVEQFDGQSSASQNRIREEAGVLSGNQAAASALALGLAPLGIGVGGYALYKALQKPQAEKPKPGQPVVAPIQKQAANIWDAGRAAVDTIFPGPQTIPSESPSYTTALGVGLPLSIAGALGLKHFIDKRDKQDEPVKTNPELDAAKLEFEQALTRERGAVKTAGYIEAVSFMDRMESAIFEKRAATPLGTPDLNTALAWYTPAAIAAALATGYGTYKVLGKMDPNKIKADAIRDAQKYKAVTEPPTLQIEPVKDDAEAANVEGMSTGKTRMVPMRFNGNGGGKPLAIAPDTFSKMSEDARGFFEKSAAAYDLTLDEFVTGWNELDTLDKVACFGRSIMNDPEGFIKQAEGEAPYQAKSMEEVMNILNNPVTGPSARQQMATTIATASKGMLKPTPDQVIKYLPMAMKLPGVSNIILGQANTGLGKLNGLEQIAARTAAGNVKAGYGDMAMEGIKHYASNMPGWGWGLMGAGAVGMMTGHTGLGLLGLLAGMFGPMLYDKVIKPLWAGAGGEKAKQDSGGNNNPNPTAPKPDQAGDKGLLANAVDSGKKLVSNVADAHVGAAKGVVNGVSNIGDAASAAKGYIQKGMDDGWNKSMDQWKSIGNAANTAGTAVSDAAKGVATVGGVAADAIGGDKVLRESITSGMNAGGQTFINSANQHAKQDMEAGRNEPWSDRINPWKQLVTKPIQNIENLVDAGSQAASAYSGASDAAATSAYNRINDVGNAAAVKNVAAINAAKRQGPPAPAPAPSAPAKPVPTPAPVAAPKPAAPAVAPAAAPKPAPAPVPTQPVGGMKFGPQRMTGI